MVSTALVGMVQASNEGVRESAEMKSRLADAKSEAQREAAACAEAKQEASNHKVHNPTFPPVSSFLTLVSLRQIYN